MFLMVCDPVQQKVHLVSQVCSKITNKIVYKILKKIKGNIGFVKVVFPKVSLQLSLIGYQSWETLLNPL